MNIDKGEGRVSVDKEVDTFKEEGSLAESSKLESLQSDLGSLIKKSREQRGLSLQEIESRTKIPKDFIESIENGFFRNVPSGVFEKGFIKCLVKELKLDDNSIVELYFQRKKLVRKSLSLRKSEFEPIQSKQIIISWLKKFINNISLLRIVKNSSILVAVLLIIFLVYAYIIDFKGGVFNLRGGNEYLNVAPKSANNIDIINKALLSTENSSEKPSQVYAEVAEKPVVTPIIEPKIELRVRDQVFIRITQGGEKLSRKSFSPGQYEIPFKGQVFLWASNGGSVEITYNKVNLVPIGADGLEKEVFFHAENFNEIDKLKL